MLILSPLKMLQKYLCGKSYLGKNYGKIEFVPFISGVHKFQRITFWVKVFAFFQWIRNQNQMRL
jgi:hypothetical protein